MHRRAVLRQLSSVGLIGVPFMRPAFASTKVRIGLALPQTGVQAEVGNDLLGGYHLAEKLAADSLGIGLDFVVDGTAEKPEAAAQVYEKWGKDKSIAAVSGLVGTPHALKAIPVAREAGMPVIGLRSGAAELRSKPGVFHLRATYDAEVHRMVMNLAGSANNQIGCIYSDDAFGKGSFDALQKSIALVASEKKMGPVSLVASVPTARDGKGIKEAVTKCFESNPRPTALVLFLIAQPMLDAAQTARELQSFLGPCYAMSFTAIKKVAEISEPWVEGLGIVSAFPLPRSSPALLAVRYRELAEKHGKPALVNSVTGLEGFFYGCTIATAAARVKGSVTRETLASALISGGPLDVQGTQVAFDKTLCGYDRLFVLRKDRMGVLRSA